MENRRKRYERVNHLLRVSGINKNDIMYFTDKDIDTVYENLFSCLKPQKFENEFENFIKNLKFLGIVNKEELGMSEEENTILKAAYLINNKYK